MLLISHLWQDTMRVLLLVILIGRASSLLAQSFSVNVSFASQPRGKVTLTLFDGDTMPRQMQRKATHGMASFSGQVSQPCYAEVSTTKGQRLGFFVENSDIAVRFDMTDPEKSAITGSRVNSQFRYALEQCRQDDGSYDASSLKVQVEENKSAVFAPLLVYRYLLPLSDPTDIAELASLMTGDATTAYHYKLLAAYLQPTDSNCYTLMPDIVFHTAQNRTLHTDSLLTDTSYNLIVVGASWCRECRNAVVEARRQLQGINIIAIDIDNDRRLWDAEVVEKMQIEHLPYLILVDPEHMIVARDIRSWEIRRIVNNHSL